MDEEQNTIYLIDMGPDGVNWCDDPAPGEGMDPGDAVKYIKDDFVKDLVLTTVATTKQDCIKALMEEMDKMKGCVDVNSPFYVFGVARIAKCIEAIEEVFI